MPNILVNGLEATVSAEVAAILKKVGELKVEDGFFTPSEAEKEKRERRRKQKEEEQRKDIVYDVEIFLKHSQQYLNQHEPDIAQANEKVWGAISFIVRRFYAENGIMILSHAATKHLAQFAHSFAGFDGPELS